VSAAVAGAQSSAPDYRLLAIRPFKDAAEAERHFDRWQRLAERVEYGSLSAEDRQRYDEAKAAYVRAAKGAWRNRDLIRRRQEAAEAWAQLQEAAGHRVPGVLRVPETFMRAVGASSGTDELHSGGVHVREAGAGSRRSSGRSRSGDTRAGPRPSRSRRDAEPLTGARAGCCPFCGVWLEWAGLVVEHEFRVHGVSP
jgi:hypothetical protein